jgi:hypothetical protein
VFFLDLPTYHEDGAQRLLHEQVFAARDAQAVELGLRVGRQAGRQAGRQVSQAGKVGRQETLRRNILADL